MTVSTSAILSLIHNEEDQYIEVSQNLWNAIAPANINKGSFFFLFYSKVKHKFILNEYNVLLEHIAVSIIVPSLKPCPLTKKKNSQSNLTAFLAKCKPTKEGVTKYVVEPLTVNLISLCRKAEI